MALRRSRVRISLGPQVKRVESRDWRAASIITTLYSLLSTFELLKSLDRSSKPSASEPGERGVSPARCPAEHSAEVCAGAELACSSQTGTGFAGEEGQPLKWLLHGFRLIVRNLFSRRRGSPVSASLRAFHRVEGYRFKVGSEA